jgi:hypothetical protein
MYQARAGQQSCSQCPGGYTAPPRGGGGNTERGVDRGGVSCKACDAGKHSYADNTECLGRFELIQRQASDGMERVKAAIKSTTHSSSGDGGGDTGDTAPIRATLDS